MFYTSEPSYGWMIFDYLIGLIIMTVALKFSTCFCEDINALFSNFSTDKIKELPFSDIEAFITVILFQLIYMMIIVFLKSLLDIEINTFLRYLLTLSIISILIAIQTYIEFITSIFVSVIFLISHLLISAFCGFLMGITVNIGRDIIFLLKSALNS